MPLSGISSKVDQRVGIRGDTSETSENIATRQLNARDWIQISLLVEKEDLFSSTAHPSLSTFTSHTFSSRC
jgi:hypothetical protein